MTLIYSLFYKLQGTSLPSPLPLALLVRLRGKTPPAKQRFDTGTKY